MSKSTTVDLLEMPEEYIRQLLRWRPPPLRRRGKGKISLELITDIAVKIAKGMPEVKACALYGIAHSAFKRAQRLEPKVDALISRAQAIFIDRALDLIIAGTPGWQSLAWVLERRHKEDFGRVATVINNSQDFEVVLTPQMQAELSSYARQMFGPAPSGRN